MENKVIVLAGTAIGSVLSLLENIKEAYECSSYVITLNSDAAKIFDSSKFVNNTIALSFEGESDFFNKFKIWYNEISFEHKPILYFTTDTSCFLVNKYREWFESNFELCLPSSNIIISYTQKGRAEFEAQKNGLLIPKTKIIENTKDILAIDSSFNFPVIIKPKSTYENSKLPFKVKILTKDDFHAITNLYVSSGFSFICQEYIPGDDEKSYFFLFYRSKKGFINYTVGRKILQNPPRAGIMAKGLVEDNQELATISRSFLDKIDYFGIGGIEFKHYNNNYYFIEMSTRLEGFFKISAISGVPLGQISYSDLINDIKPRKDFKQIPGRLYVDIFGAIVAEIKNRSYGKVLKEIFNVFFNKNQKLNTYSKYDKVPFFILTMKTILK